MLGKEALGQEALQTPEGAECGEGGPPGPMEGLAQGGAQAQASQARASHRKQLEVGFEGWGFFKG